MDKLINDIDVVDEVGKATDVATDIKYLSWEIRKEFFSPTFKTEHEQKSFVWSAYERTTSLFRILDDLIFNLSDILTNLDKSISGRELKGINATQDNTESENNNGDNLHTA